MRRRGGPSDGVQAVTVDGGVVVEAHHATSHVDLHREPTSPRAEVVIRGDRHQQTNIEHFAACEDQHRAVACDQPRPAKPGPGSLLPRASA